ncbi:YolD-like family protein, partial [Mycobacterium tuberculosis]
RMMLPEHKEVIIRQQVEENKKTKPILDSQEVELIQLALAESLHQHRRINLQLYDEYKDIHLSGFVVLINAYKREFKFVTNRDEWHWVSVQDIVSVSS